MRTLLLFRGAPGCGKSTFIKEHGLKPYTLCADDIRLLCQSPMLEPDGSVAISQNNENVVWRTLFQLLQVRMQRGEFTVIDATNSKTCEMNKYKQLCQDYRYRIYCIDLTDLPIEECKRRNASREPLKRVPEAVIDKMYSRFATQQIPSGIKVIKPDELDQIMFNSIDLSEYKKIHHIGDVHGCYTALKEYIDNNGGLKDDECYIFCGDYIDRGIENVEVINFLLSIYNKPNVLLLEGNHEQWIKTYAHDVQSKSKEFELMTKKQLDDANISKKDLRCLYRKFIQCAYYTYHDKKVLVTHAGLSTLPENMLTVATEQMIKGVGSYNDVEFCDDSFMENTDSNTYQIHGHRNTKSVPIQTNDRCFNLENHVEFGGNLRCVQLSEDGFTCIEIKNNVFRTEEEKEEIKELKESSVSDIILALRNNRFIKEKKFGNISSFNFTNQAFYDKVWDEQTVKARGLYLDTVKGKVFCRGYEKFFNINERPETKLDMLQYKLQFPVTAYVKENGFLGIVAYNEYEDDLFITTKSNPDGDFAEWFKILFETKVSDDNREKIKQHCKEHDVSFVFECVDMVHDPHIIKYPESKIVLLDIVYNDIEFKKYDYETLKYIGNEFGLTVKEKAYEIANWQDFFDWYYEVLDENYEYNGNKIEGFVIEDATGYMTKLKLAYYNFWKFMRSVSHEAIRKGYINKTGTLTTPLANNYYAWVRKLFNLSNEEKEALPKDICSLRDMYYADALKTN
jgi:predicted kinase